MLSRNAYWGSPKCQSVLLLARSGERAERVPEKARSYGVRGSCSERKHPVIARQPWPHFHLRPQMCVIIASQGSKKLRLVIEPQPGGASRECQSACYRLAAAKSRGGESPAPWAEPTIEHGVDPPPGAPGGDVPPSWGRHRLRRLDWSAWLR